MTTTIAIISPAELHEKMSGGDVNVIDVRTPAEFCEMHISVASNRPLDSLDPHAIMRAHGSVQRPLYLICLSGNRARMACEKFVAAGYENVVNVEGGTRSWEAAGLPVKRGKKAVSLERQVRILAGTLVFLGAILAWLVHPGFVFLSGFIGAGLVFAGVTDTCGMAMALAKMPWNRVSGESCVNSIETPSGI